MSNPSHQPQPFDVVLATPVAHGSSVLGGLAGVQQRLRSAIETQRIAALAEAVKYGYPGLELVIQATRNETDAVRAAASVLLKNSIDAQVEPLSTHYDRYHFFQCLQTLAAMGEVQRLLLSTDGKTLISNGNDGKIQVWDLQQGKQRLMLKVPYSISRTAGYLIALSPDGSTLFGGDRQLIRVWDMQQGNEIQALAGHTTDISVLTCTADGQTLISGSQDGMLRLWHIPTGTLQQILHRHSARIRAIAITPDDQVLASCSSDQTIHLWHLPSGQLILTLPGSIYPTCALFTPHHPYLLVGTEGERTIPPLKIWNWQTAEAAFVLPTRAKSIAAMALTADGKTLFITHKKGTEVWDLLQQTPICYIKGHDAATTALALSLNGETLFTASKDRMIQRWAIPFTAVQPAKVGVLHLQQARALPALQHGNSLRALAFSPDGQTLFSADDRGIIKIWNWQTGKELQTIAAHLSSVTQLIGLADRQTLMSASRDSTIRIWDWQSGVEQFAIHQHAAHLQDIVTHTNHPDRLIGIALSRDQQTLISVNGSNQVQVWNLRSKRIIQQFTLSSHTGAIATFALSPDAQILVSAGGFHDRTLRCWDLASGHQIGMFGQYRSGAPSCLRFLPEGQQVLSGGSDGTLRLWDVATMQIIETFQSHQKTVTAIDISPNGKTIVSSGWEGTIKVWNREIAQKLQTLGKASNNFMAGFDAVATHGDGITFAAGNRYGMIHLWTIE